jgi:hypothetical protein
LSSVFVFSQFGHGVLHSRGQHRDRRACGWSLRSASPCVAASWCFGAGLPPGEKNHLKPVKIQWMVGGHSPSTTPPSDKGRGDSSGCRTRHTSQQVSDDGPGDGRLVPHQRGDGTAGRLQMQISSKKRFAEIMTVKVYRGWRGNLCAVLPWYHCLADPAKEMMQASQPRQGGRAHF